MQNGTPLGKTEWIFHKLKYKTLAEKLQDVAYYYHFRATVNGQPFSSLFHALKNSIRQTAAFFRA